MKYDKLYQELKEKYSDEEIGEAMVFPVDLPEKEKNEADEEFRKLRFERLKNKTVEDKIFSDLMRLQFEIMEYLKKDVFSFEKTFGKILREYIHIIRKPKREIAEDLSLHYTKLSRLLNDKEDPNVELAFRLEKHSDKIIPAIYWWKLLVKKQAFIISKDTETRRVEYGKVKGLFKMRA